MLFAQRLTQLTHYTSINVTFPKLVNKFPTHSALLENSLRISQNTACYPYFEPDHSGLRSQNYLLKIRFNIIILPTRWSTTLSFLSVLTAKALYGSLFSLLTGLIRISCRPEVAQCVQ